MAGNRNKGNPGLMGWIDDRFPATAMWEDHLSKYYAPKNFNFWYFFGSLALLVLVNQILTGIWLTMSFNPSAEGAFASVEYIMRDVEFGWLLRYMHSTGASAFFIVVYMHMFRGMMYGSYKAPRELIWIFGMAIYLALMAEAFMGYLLPWGQMSYWGAQVIISLFTAIPGIGADLAQWIRGDYLISGVTLNRFFALHVIALPIVLLALVVLHILALHEVGSNNPDGNDIKKHKDEKYIFPCSDIRKNDIPNFLKENGYTYSEAVIYKTVASDLSDLSDIKYDVIAFFSPSGINSLFVNFPEFKQNNTRIAAFGPTTAKAVNSADLVLDIEAPLPNAPSMTGALELYVKRANGLN